MGMSSSELNKMVLLVLAAAACALFLFDAWLVASRGNEFSVSAMVNRLAREYPALPFGAGLLVAHLFRF